uniref:RING-type domain-containing protein n=1 Tax=viral metagenome TaxID=1070528 RepID=A0A6C0KCR2_9ZZZZ
MPDFDWKNRPEVSEYLECQVDNYRAGLEDGQSTLWKRDLAPAFMAEFPDFCVGEPINIVAGRLRQRWISIEKERTESGVTQPRHVQPTRQELLDTVKELKKDNKRLHRKLVKCENKPARLPNHVVELMADMYTSPGEQKECPICLEAIAGADLRITNCGHFFHKECLGRVVRDVCPTCRTRGCNV